MICHLVGIGCNGRLGTDRFKDHLDTDLEVHTDIVALLEKKTERDHALSTPLGVTDIENILGPLHQNRLPPPTIQ